MRGSTVHYMTDIPALRALLKKWRDAQQTIALVPTMGNLHQGHLSLVEKAKAVADKAVVTIFVNPLQFGPNEDYAEYPRTLEADCAQLETLNVDLVFTPTAEQLYPRGLQQCTKVEVPELNKILCGVSRPQFFTGVTTVVNLLFNIIQPDKAIFGQKDYQQLLIVKRMVKDLWMPIEILGMPTYRETDGLAMSSRNGYLTPEQRAIAPTLFHTLMSVKEKLVAGHRDFAVLEQQAISTLTTAGFTPDYIKICNTYDLHPATSTEKEFAVLAAAWLGKTRLIDNIEVIL